MSDVPKDDAYVAFVKEGLKGMDEAAAEINRMTEARIRRVPEPHFRKTLLGVVRAWVTKAEPAPEIGYWLNVADGLNNSFHVVDEHDNVLFTVPPPFVDIKLDTKYDPSLRFKSIWQHVTLQGVHFDNNDQRKFWEMEQQLIAQAGAKPQDQTLATALTQLTEMYQYYNLPLEEILGAEGAASVRPLLPQSGGASQPSSSNSGISDDPDAYDY